MPIAYSGDGIFRGNPCGRPSRGALSAVVAGSAACVSFRMSVSHTSSFRVALAPGMVEGSPSNVESGRPAHRTPFDDPAALVSRFECGSLPGGCESDPSGRGDYVVPIRLPNTTTPGLYTLQLRQWAADLSWYYVSDSIPCVQEPWNRLVALPTQYDCADIIVAANESGIPPALRASWQATSCSGNASGLRRSASFSHVAYPSPILRAWRRTSTAPVGFSACLCLGLM